MNGNSLFPIFKVYDFLNQILSEESGKIEDIIYHCASFYAMCIFAESNKNRIFEVQFLFSI